MTILIDQREVRDGEGHRVELRRVIDNRAARDTVAADMETLSPARTIGRQ